MFFQSMVEMMYILQPAAEFCDIRVFETFFHPWSTRIIPAIHKRNECQVNLDLNINRAMRCMALMGAKHPHL